MEAPKCKLCGDRHYGMCAQNSKPSTKPTTRPAVPTLTSKTTAKSSSGASERIDLPPKPGFDRKSYQRDYMRAYRARQKAQE